ncbi:MAG: sensor domain-containing diguanylate cyclase, partial [Burkholderiales bacterium]
MSPLIDGLLDAAWLVEPQSLRVLAANAQAATLLGIDVPSLCRTDALALAATPEDVAFWEAALGGALDSADKQTVLSTVDGRLVPVLRRVTRINPGVPAESRHGVYLVVMRDRSLELGAQAELEERLSELRATLDSTADGILVLDLNGGLVNFNLRFAELWELPEALLAARDAPAVAAWMLRRVADPVTYSKRLQGLTESPSLEGTDVLILRSGKVLERRTLPQRNRGQAIGRVYAFRDVTESYAERRRSEHSSSNDALTGLPSRRLVADRIEYALALAQREGTAFALLHLDLDRFKPINDALGPVAGDQVLVEVAKRLSATMRQVDTVCRLGDDEYLMLLHQADMQRAEGAARRVMESLQRAFVVGGVNLTVTASIGIALYPGDGSTAEELLHAADVAMADIKAAGGAGFRLHHQRVGATVVALRTRMKLDLAMRQALAAGRFRLHYQPQ